MTNFSSLGGSNSGPSVFYSRSIVLGVSKYLGKHNLKSGFVFRSISVDFTDLSNGNGSFSFANDFVSPNDPLGKNAKLDLLNLLTGYASTGSSVPQTIHLATNVPYYAGYFQDDYRLTNKLTLNLGLRYEWEAGLSERSNHYAVGFDQNVTNPLQTTSSVTTKGGIEFASQNGYPTTCCDYSKKKFGPRIGAAYALNAKTTIRLGYGTFYSPSAFTSNSAFAPGYSQATAYVYSNDGGKNPAGSPSNPYPRRILGPDGNANGFLCGILSDVSPQDQGSTS